MITLKDIIDLKPYGKICIKNVSFVDAYNHCDDYIVSDMKPLSDDYGIELLVCPKDGFCLKYGKYGEISAGLELDKFYKDASLELELELDEDELDKFYED